MQLSSRYRQEAGVQPALETGGVAAATVHGFSLPPCPSPAQLQPLLPTNAPFDLRRCSPSAVPRPMPLPLTAAAAAGASTGSLGTAACRSTRPAAR